MDHLDGLVRKSIEDTLNTLLNEDADAICNASRYQRSPDRQDTRAGTYKRKLLTTSGEVEQYLIFGYNLSNVSVFVAVGVNDEGYREILSFAEGSRENKESWTNFLRYLKDRGLAGVKLIVSDKCSRLHGIIGDFFRLQSGSAVLSTGIGIHSR